MRAVSRALTSRQDLHREISSPWKRARKLQAAWGIRIQYQPPYGLAISLSKVHLRDTGPADTMRTTCRWDYLPPYTAYYAKETKTGQSELWHLLRQSLT